MPPLISRELGYLGFQRETTQGTPLAPTSFVKLIKQAFMIEQNFADIRSGLQDITNSVKLFIDFKGGVQTYFYPDEGGRLLAAILGKDVVSGAGDPWTHTLTILDNIPYYTFEADFFADGIIDRVADCKLSSWLLTAKAAELATIDFDLMGCGSAAQVTPATVTFSDALSEGPMIFWEGVFTLVGPTDATALQGQLAAVSLKVDRKCRFVRSNNIVPIYVLETVREITFNFDAYFSGPNLYQLTYFGANAATAPSGVPGNGSATLKFTSAAAPEHSALFTLNNFIYKTATPEFSPDGKEAVLHATATLYRSGATLPMTAVVKNGVSSQYTA